MKTRNIAIYFPQSTSFFEVGGKIVDQEGKPTKNEVLEISVFMGKITVKLTSGTFIYKNLPYSISK